MSEMSYYFSISFIRYSPYGFFLLVEVCMDNWTLYVTHVFIYIAFHAVIFGKHAVYVRMYASTVTVICS